MQSPILLEKEIQAKCLLHANYQQLTGKALYLLSGFLKKFLNACLVQNCVLSCDIFFNNIKKKTFEILMCVFDV